MSSSCPVCDSKIEEEDLFCFRCGSNLKVQQLSNFKDLSSILTSDPIEDLKRLNEEIEKLVHLDTLLEEQQEYLSSFNMILENIQKDVGYAQGKVNKFSKIMNKLTSISLIALKEWILRRRDDKINKYSHKLEKYTIDRDIFAIHEQITVRYIEVATTDLEFLQELLSRKNEVQQKRTQILQSIAPEKKLQRSEKLKYEIKQINEQLGQIARTLRRLRISLKYFESSLDDLKKINKIVEEDKDIQSMEIMETYLSSFDSKLYSLPMDKFLAANILRKIQGVITYSSVLGELVVDIPNAGSISIGTYFEDILPDFSQDNKLTKIIDYREKIKDTLEIKITYLRSIIDIVSEDYQEKRQKVASKLENRLEFDLYIIQSYLSRNE